MRITKEELYDRYYSSFISPTPVYLYREDNEMPNHCHNRVTFYSANTEAVAKLKQIFEDENCFGQIIPEPDWANIPLDEKTAGNWLHPTRGKVGELPVKVDGDFGISQRFKSTGVADDRWYDWRLQNWDTKWEASEIEFECDDSEILTITFDTAWSPPEGVMEKLREKFPDVSFQCFYDEPGCESAGYY